MGRKVKIRKYLSPEEREFRLRSVRRVARVMGCDDEAALMTEEDLLAMYEKAIKLVREAKQAGCSFDDETSGETLNSMPSSYIRRSSG